MGTMTFAAYGRGKETFEKRIFGKGQKMMFENILCEVPECWDEYLTALYKNYMELPPVEKRVSNHTFVARYKEDATLN